MIPTDVAPSRGNPKLAESIKSMAWLELRHSFKEWQRLIPGYRIRSDSPIRRHVATVAGLDELHLEWG